MAHFAIVNESTNPGLSPSILTQIANACQEQTETDYSLEYDSQGSTVESYGALADAPVCDKIIHYVDLIPEAPDAEAYHTIDENGTPVVRVGVNTILSGGGTIVDGATSISCATSHEILETLEDLYCSQWNDWDGTNTPPGATQGRKVAYEICDPVQDQSYKINAISVSNFVTRDWFDVDVGQSCLFDKLGSLTKPRSITDGGYVVFDDGTQQFGPAMSEAKRFQKSTYGRRVKKVRI